MVLVPDEPTVSESLLGDRSSPVLEASKVSCGFCNTCRELDSPYQNLSFCMVILFRERIVSKIPDVVPDGSMN